MQAKGEQERDNWSNVLQGAFRLPNTWTQIKNLQVSKYQLKGLYIAKIILRKWIQDDKEFVPTLKFSEDQMPTQSDLAWVWTVVSNTT